VRYEGEFGDLRMDAAYIYDFLPFRRCAWMASMGAVR